jgi:hypothetical protein
LRNFKSFVIWIGDFESKIEVSQSEEIEVQRLHNGACLFDVIAVSACIVKRESDGGCVFRRTYHPIVWFGFEADQQGN